MGGDSLCEYPGCPYVVGSVKSVLCGVKGVGAGIKGGRGVGADDGQTCRRLYEMPGLNE